MTACGLKIYVVYNIFVSYWNKKYLRISKGNAVTFLGAVDKFTTTYTKILRVLCTNIIEVGSLWHTYSKNNKEAF